MSTYKHLAKIGNVFELFLGPCGRTNEVMGGGITILGILVEIWCLCHHFRSTWFVKIKGVSVLACTWDKFYVIYSLK